MALVDRPLNFTQTFVLAPIPDRPGSLILRSRATFLPRAGQSPHSERGGCLAMVGVTYGLGAVAGSSVL
ncbi:hypothetical protein F4556_006396 [Kitasatospora gansuensis]|uniref:Uncharacterized protein n=1 Tax=Kitasatospora gansuensis TaxID=258050 RepID=A0A7W7SK83_9ACTN|nr:hypothetical protein [Kitasatospora gansuensis]MBB4950861.1 hypothetical protein [Kitasatospora gansuensis]